MNISAIKQYLKNLNIDELLFDILLLVVANALGLFIISDKLFAFNENTDAFRVGTVIAFGIFILSINIGTLYGKYKEYKKAKKLRLVFVFFILFLAFMFFLITGEILDDLDSLAKSMFPFISLLSMIAGFSLGYFTVLKGFKKSLKTTGIVSFSLLIIALSVFSFLAINHNDFSIVYWLIDAAAIVLGIIFLIILPSKTASFILKRDKLKKAIGYFFVILSAIIFSLWSFTNENIFTSVDEFGFLHKSSFYELAFLPIVVYRFLLAAAPPWNKVNIIVGGIVLILTYYL